ncbi:SDR family NAD(P)-dependent oxidoreductase [Tepidibacillus fermentans]|uniref:NAD(P)-dependent dehydrogenase (Short-subunit alcohol dehydrogenase family) n=1 Tax=Tepidibacillus fermentans TaxID=1281767 RepID=A0A4R3KHD8_9BACI|nr:glucose 1-dehydrogenase [Tepidibacillus fermentans]TCS82439.1 NAD(P)-dependent dehydrogenase (short-subunit alcohol dehydrogenase family) [Tepidibacillus fermentans]
MDLFNLEGKVAVITGSGKGIGKAIALGLADAGADVVVVARTQSDIDQTVLEIEQKGRKAIGISTDVKKKEEIERMVEQTLHTFGKIDILINNAGMNIRTPALEVSEEEWELIIQTNMKSVFLASQAVGKHMVEQKHGSIINISSVAGHVALRTGVAYAATKAGIIQMTKTLALEWGKYNVRVNAIAPWYFKTPLTEKLLTNKEYYDEVISRTPLRRVGDVKELVGPAVFLASDASSYVTGHTIFVDGGMSIYGF